MAESFGANFSIDISQLKAGLNTANKLIRESQSEFKAAAAGMDDWTKSEAGLMARNKMLTQQIDIQREKVKKLGEYYQNELANGMDESSDRAIYLRTQLKNEEAALVRNEAELKKNQQALQNLGDEAEETGKDIEKSGDGWAKFGDAAKAATKVALTAIAAISAGVVALTKSAVSSYADYEQLIGGVETLFGAGGQSLEEYAKSVGKTVDEAKSEYDKLISAQDSLIENANNAYKTAGMSANEYMQNVTSFSASLISSLGGDTVKAAAAADRAMTDISDNANKMGTDMQSIVDTYQSLARGNFQMLDNLKLGYGGTKAEMQRMIADANKVKAANGEMANLSVDSFADITEAIHIIQNEMGITGTTAKEASSTISGSVASMKAAWKNMLTGIADDTQDFDALIDNFVESVATAAENLLPRISTALKGIIKLVEKLLPQLPPLIAEFLPVIVDGIMNITNGIVKVLPQIVNTITEAIPMLITALIEMTPTILDAVIEIILNVIDGITKMIPKIVDAVVKIIPKLTKSLVAALPKILKAAIQLLMGIVEAIPVIVKELSKELPSIIEQIVKTLTENISIIIDGAIQLLMGIVEAIPVIITALVEALPRIIDTIVSTLLDAENLQKIIDGAIKLLMGIIDAIPKIITALVEALPKIISTITDTLLSPKNIQLVIDGALQLLMGIVEALPQLITALVEALPQIITTITNTLLDAENIQKIFDGAIQLFMGIIKAIPEFAGTLIENMPQIIDAIIEGLVNGLSAIFDFGKEIVSTLWDGIKSAAGWLSDKVSGFIDGIFGEGSADSFSATVGSGVVAGFATRVATGTMFDSTQGFVSRDTSAGGNQTNKNITINQYNTYSQSHSRYELYKSKQDTAAAVRLAIGTVN